MRPVIIVLLIIILTSCASIAEPASIKTPVPTDTFTLVPTSTFTLTPISLFTATPILVTETPPPPTALPTQITHTALPPTQEWTYAVITPESAELERWREYEEALGNAIYERVPRDDIICEWLIMGRAKREVYVWAACSGIRPYDSKLTTFTQCAVVYLGADGEVQSIGTTENTPGSPAENRRKLFPPGIYERCVHTPADSMMEHLESRRENPELPLIVLDATPTP